MPEPIVFFFEFTSPYAYLAAQRVDAAAARGGRAVDWKAISLGHVLKTRGVSREDLPKEKLDYIRYDARRAAEMLGFPLRTPEVFPVDAKAARLAFFRLKARDPQLAAAFARAVYARYWGEGRDISTPPQLAAAAADLGVGADEIAAALEDAAAKRAMIDATNDAIARGVFGAPSFIVDGELFWGQDRIEMMEWRLANPRST